MKGSAKRITQAHVEKQRDEIETDIFMYLMERWDLYPVDEFLVMQAFKVTTEDLNRIYFNLFKQGRLHAEAEEEYYN